MTYVVVELCVDCKYTDCAAVCPVEAFHELPDRLYINADTCIDCDACVPESVEAIFADSNVPENTHWTQSILTRLRLRIAGNSGPARASVRAGDNAASENPSKE